MSALALDEIQGLVFSGYARQRFASFLLLRVEDPQAAAAWLAEAGSRVSFAANAAEPTRMNVAVSGRGLARLGVPQRFLSSFGPAFRDGLGSSRRARLLGDTGDSAPERWSWGGPAHAVDLAVLLYAESERALAERVEAERARGLAGPGFTPVERLEAQPLPTQGLAREHFGFADGISQPIIAGGPRDRDLSPGRARLHRVAAGEFLLGHANAYDRITAVPRIADDGAPFGRNGSYLVLRQLLQDVAGFWRYFDHEARRREGSDVDALRVQLASKAVGRWPDGTPLTTRPDGPDPGRSQDDAFRYAADDPHGERCPLGAHVRRANPRDALEEDADTAVRNANSHRIMRRGRPYGEPLVDPQNDDGRERGLLFVCLNANLERQFEFVQHSWVDNAKFDALYDEVDPVVGAQPPGGGLFTMQGSPLRRRLHGVPRFVTVRGGAYFFLPSRAGIRQLAALAAGGG